MLEAMATVTEIGSLISRRLDIRGASPAQARDDSAAKGAAEGNILAETFRSPSH
jgi:hypothetical protein